MSTRTKESSAAAGARFESSATANGFAASAMGGGRTGRVRLPHGVTHACIKHPLPFPRPERDTDLSSHTADHLARIAATLNNRPRPTLTYGL
ncbi:hypothetical protein GCM10027026_00730 [Myroides odoratimimus subsp. xuanwuensis]